MAAARERSRSARRITLHLKHMPKVSHITIHFVEESRVDIRESRVEYMTVSGNRNGRTLSQVPTDPVIEISES